MNYEVELKAAIEAAKEAQKVILEIYKNGFDVEIKSDNTPVTKADKEADKLIRKILSKQFPNHGFLTEESKDDGSRFNYDYVWIVDPVDGTTEFVSQNGQFTTNIALAYKGQLVLGVINAPVLNECFYAVKGEGAFKIDKDGKVTQIHTSDRKSSFRGVKSISHSQQDGTECYESHQELFEGELEAVGAALKFCYIAEGKKDFFSRMSAGTKEWDTAAGDIILTEAGGLMVQPNGEPFTYNREDVYNREGYYLVNKPENLSLFLAKTK